jgi:hypothetical protein
MHAACLLALLPALPAPLCGRLAAPDFRARESAHRALAGCGRLALPALLRAAAGHPSAEGRRRAECLLAPFEEELADLRSRRIRPSAWPCLPWLAINRLDYAGPSQEHYLAPARLAFPAGGPPHYPAYREATRLWVRAQLVQRRPLTEIVRDLDRMVEDELYWHAQCRQPNLEPPARPELVLPPLETRTPVK